MVGSFGSEACKGKRAPARSLWAGAIAVLALVFAAAHSAWAQEDPPGRVGRLNYLQGTISFSPAGSDEWVEARTTRPITSGDRLWSGRDARSELSIGSTVIRAGEQTGLKVLQLDDDQAQFQLSEGSVAIHVRNLDPDDRLEIATPDVAFVVDRPGDYRIDVDPDKNVTTIAVEHGQGTAYADDGQHRLSSPSYARFVPEGLDQASADLPRRDDFDRWAAARIERAESRPAARYVPREMVGYEDLDDYGSWREEPDYGSVWVPRITVAAWAPYRYGHWAWIAPWGWTWVDDQPWGFAPFHYGRWAYVRSRWCWVPGPIVRRPYYAPALVAFVGSPGGASLTISSGPAVAWFPLAPRDEYRPVYRASATYITRINQVVIVDRERGGGRRSGGEQFANRFVAGAATALPARAFVEGRPVGREQVRVTEGELRQASVAGTMPALAPVKASLVGQQSRRVEAPPRQERERQVVTTRMPATPPVDRDELAKRFAQSGTKVRDAGQPLAEQTPRREENQKRQERAVRVVGPRREADQAEERRSPQQDERRGSAPQPAAAPQADRPAQDRERDRPGRELRGDKDRPERERPGRPPEAGQPAEAQRAAPEPRRDEVLRDLRPAPERREETQRTPRQEPPARPEAAEPARRPPESREANRPPEAQRGAPDSRRDEVLRDLRPAPERREESQRSPRPEAPPALVPRQERKEEGFRPPDRPADRPIPEVRRERAPEPERGHVERPAIERVAPPQPQPQPQPQARPEARPEPQDRSRPEEGGKREHKDAQRERNNPLRQNPNE